MRVFNFSIAEESLSGVVARAGQSRAVNFGISQLFPLKKKKFLHLLSS